MNHPFVALHVAAIGRMRRAVVRVQAEPGEREFAHVRATDDHGARASQAGDHERVGLRRRRVGEHAGTGARHLAFDVEEVLHRHWNARERREHGTRAAERVVGVRGGAGGVGIDVQEDGGTLARGVLDAFQRALDQRAAGRAVLAQVGG
jgi:hypothetical protein